MSREELWDLYFRGKDKDLLQEIKKISAAETDNPEMKFLLKMATIEQIKTNNPDTISPLEIATIRYLLSPSKDQSDEWSGLIRALDAFDTDDALDTDAIVCQNLLEEILRDVKNPKILAIANYHMAALIYRTNFNKHQFFTTPQLIGVANQKFALKMIHYQEISNPLLQKALQHLEQARKLCTTYLSLYMMYGDLYYESGNFQTALNAYYIAFSINQKYRGLNYKIGLCYLNQGNIDEASKLFWSEAYHHPDHVVVYLTHVTLLLGMGELINAEYIYSLGFTNCPDALFKELITYFPRNGIYWMYALDYVISYHLSRDEYFQAKTALENLLNQLKNLPTEEPYYSKLSNLKSKSIDRLEKCKIKMIILRSVSFKIQYRLTDMYYRPGNIGFQKAQQHFNQLAAKISLQ